MTIKIKALTIFFATLLFSYTIMSPVMGQNLIDLNETEEEMLFEEDRPADIIDNQSLQADFKQYTQDPGSKIVRFEMIIDSKIDSDRVRVTWDVVGNSNVINEDQLTQIISVRSGEQYIIPLELRPIGQGVTEILGTARVVNVDSSVITTVRKNFASNSKGEVLPLTDDYKSKRLVNTIFNIAKTIFFILLAIAAGFFGFKQFVKWYNKDRSDEEIKFKEEML